MGCFNTVHDVRGNVRVRGCTDILCLVAYIIFWILLFAVMTFSFVYGDPKRLIQGYDSFGNICGSDVNEDFGYFSSLSGIDTTSMRYMFSMSSNNSEYALKICVKSCPDRDIQNFYDLSDFYARTSSNLCRYDFTASNISSYTTKPLNFTEVLHSKFGPCPELPVKQSIPLLNRCVPNTTNEPTDLFNEFGLFHFLIIDIYSQWASIALLCALAVGLSILSGLSIFLFPLVSGGMIMGFSCVFTLVGSVATWFKFDSWLNGQLFKVLPGWISSELTLTYIILCLIVTASSVFILCVPIFTYKKVDRLKNMFLEISTCLSDVPSLYFLPLITLVFLSTFFILWTYVVFCLFTARVPKLEILSVFDQISPESQVYMNESQTVVPLQNSSLLNVSGIPVIIFSDDVWICYMWWILILGLLWIPEFILACQRMVISGTVATWYFEEPEKRSKVKILPILTNTMLYNLGSAALGAILITIGRVPRVLIKFYYYQRRKRNDAKKVTEAYKGNYIKPSNVDYWEQELPTRHWCCRYNFIHYMNSNAYTVVAIQCVNFFTAAKRAQKIVDWSGLRISFDNILGDIIIFMAKFGISVLTGSVTILLLSEDEHFPATPALIVAIFSYYIAHCILSLYEIVLDTLYLCMYEDADINGLSGFWKTSLLNRRPDNALQLETLHLEGHQHPSHPELYAVREPKTTLPN